MLEHCPRESRTEVISLSKDVAHHQRTEHNVRFGVTPVAEVHIGACIFERPRGQIDHVFRSLETISADMGSLARSVRWRDGRSLGERRGCSAGKQQSKSHLTSSRNPYCVHSQPPIALVIMMNLNVP